MSKTRFLAVSYFGAAFFTGFSPAATVATDAKGWVLAVSAGVGAGFVALRAFADQTPAQCDAHDPEPVIHQ